MPKLKTHKGMAKRIKLSGGGKMLRRKAYRSHLLAHKQASTKRTYVKEYEISAGDAANVKKMLGTYK
jgi:large subunit ribosomal protein L35